jgi:HSP20 family protein
VSRDLIRLMHALFSPYAARPVVLLSEEAGEREQAPWRPNTDVLRTPDGWLVRFELAGVRADDIELEVLGRRMTLRGARRDLCAAEGGVYYQMEILYSRFERSLELPCDLKRAHIDTDYRDGVLCVRVRTAPEQEEERRV